MPARIVFVFFLLPALVGGLTAATWEIKGAQRLGRFIAAGVLVGAAYAYFPWGEPVPPDQRIPTIAFVFLLPMTSTSVFATARAATANVLGYADSTLARVILGFLFFLVSLTAFVGLGAHFDVLQLADAFPGGAYYNAR